MKEPLRCDDLQSVEPDHQETIRKINEMSHIEMCRLWRFAPVGHPYFDKSLPFAKLFEARLFGHFGGFTPSISKVLTL